VIDSIDREELAKILALKIDQGDEEAEVLISFSCAFSYPCYILMYHCSSLIQNKVRKN
jgi:hypothetical protein